MDIGKRIRQLREELGWTQEALAKVCGVPQAAISKIERGKTKPLYETIFKIGQAMEVDLNTLAGIPTSEKVRGLDSSILFLLESDPSLAETLKNPEIVQLLRALSSEYGLSRLSKRKDLMILLQNAVRLLEDEEREDD